MNEQLRFSRLSRSQIAPFVWQLLLVPPIVAIPTLLLLVPLDWLPMFEKEGATCPLQAIDILILALVSLAFGIVAARWKPSLFLPSGLWIWLPPTVLILVIVLSAMTSAQQGESPGYDLYCANGSNEGLMKYFIGFPSFACIGYSIGLYAGRRWKIENNSAA